MIPGQAELDRIYAEWREQCVYKPIDMYFKSGKYEVRDMNSMIFRLFDKYGFFQFSDKRENEIIEEAKREYVYKNKSGYNVENINDLITLMQKGKKNVNASIELTRNRIKLKTFLSDCREVNRDIISEIKELDKQESNH